MARGQEPVDHLLRRAGFGAGSAELTQFQNLSLASAIDRLVDYQLLTDDVDSKIGQVGYVGVTTRGGQFSPNTNIEDARQRWLFRMVHSQRPLQEKMALFWHNHFATAYSKVAGFGGAVQGTKMMALKAGELPGPQGQLETFRQMALGRFRDLLVAVAMDPAMVVFLDGRTNTRARPQENFGREIMELFTFGLGNYVEQDVYAAARVFTGWNLRLVGASANDPNSYYEFFYNAAQHELTAKTFTFAIYPDGGKTIPARAATDGMLDGIDFINALARHPQTARRLARKLWDFFVSEVYPPDPLFVDTIAAVYLQTDTDMRAVVQAILRSAWFQNPGNWYTRYSWPAEYVVRAMKEMGYVGFSVDSVRTPMTNMGQTLFEPPDVSGWDLGENWFSSGAMLARMNFASTLAANQKFILARDTGAYRSSPDRVLGYFLDRMTPAPYDSAPYGDLLGYLQAGPAWSGSDAQLNSKCPGLARLIVGSSEYQLN